MSRINLLIKKKSILQYFYIYLMIQFIGGRLLSAIQPSIFYGLTLLISLFFLFRRQYLIIYDKKFFKFIIILAYSLLFTCVLTTGGLSIPTLISIISRFLIVYIAVVVDRENFIKRFLKLVYIMCIISLVLYALVMILGTDRLSPIYSNLYEIKNRVEWMGSSYGLFFIVFNFMDPSRNAYMFGEPGEYQILVITAMYLLVFKYNSINIKINDKRKYLIVFIITIISIQSATGFFNFGMLLLVSLVHSRKKIPLKIKRVLTFVLITLGIYLLFFATENSIFYTKFLSKFITDSNTIDFSITTGEDRVDTIKKLFSIIKTYPHLLIFGVGYEGVVKLNGSYSISGIVNTVVMLGMFTCIILYGFIVRNIIKYSKSIGEVILLIFIIINMGLSQPDLLSIMTVLIGCYEFLVKNNKYFNKSNKKLKSIS